MKKIVLAFVFYAFPALVMASGAECGLYGECDKANIDLHNKASLQRGAKMFVNYCMGCHSLKFMSYERMGQDLGLSKEQVLKNFVFNGGKIGDYMKIAMPEELAANWFGAAPPDLSLVSRSRGPNWLYTYLRTFYVDESRPWGVNNLVFKDVGMPHVLWELQGLKKAVFVEKEVHGKKEKVFDHFETVTEGKVSGSQYDQDVTDLVAFLTYAGEPAGLVRKEIGVWVILFMVIFLVVSYQLKKEYWKDVH